MTGVLNKITPLIITYNEAANIRRTLDKLAWARRIVVVDSGSTDETLQIVRGYPRVEVIPHGIEPIVSGDPAGARLTLGIPSGVAVLSHFGFLHVGGVEMEHVSPNDMNRWAVADRAPDYKSTVLRAPARPLVRVTTRRRTLPLVFLQRLQTFPADTSPRALARSNGETVWPAPCSISGLRAPGPRRSWNGEKPVPR